MASEAMPARGRNDRLFYMSMGLLTLAIVFVGFAPSYYLSPWLDPPAGTPEVTLLLHVHGAVFTAWMLLSVVQPYLIASRRRNVHRKLGYVGAALAVLLVVLGVYAGARAMHVGFIGLGDPMAFFAIPFFAMVTFAVIVGLAIHWRNRAETHKRLMLLANTQLIEAAFARILIMAGMPLPPLFFLTSDLIILIGMGYDWMSRGRIHKVWLWGGGLVVLSQIFRVAVSGTDLWLGFAGFVKGLV